MQKIKISAIFGTRPEAIKMCPLVLELKKNEAFDTRVILSGQHRELCREVTDFFGVKPDADFNIMSRGQSLFDITEKIMQCLRRELEAHRPSLLLVHGDTATAFAGAITAFYAGISVGHVEAGLRSDDPFSPFPEEFYRRSIDALSYCHFCPTETAKQRIIAEGIPRERIFVTGNTAVDAMAYTAKEKPTTLSHPTAVVTLHRRESRGDKMKKILSGLRRAVEDTPKLRVIFPVHPSQEVRRAVGESLSGCERIDLCEPMPLPEFHSVLSGCDFILSDSGGLQEEAVTLKKPLLLVRENTERPEGISSGYVFPVGCAEGAVYDAVCRFAKSPPVIKESENPFGDGRASQHIVEAILSLHLENGAKM